MADLASNTLSRDILLHASDDDFDEFLYVVDSGTFTAIDNENAKTLLRRGGLVGEIAFISGGKRVNTVLSARTPKNAVYALRRSGMLYMHHVSVSNSAKHGMYSQQEIA